MKKEYEIGDEIKINSQLFGKIIQISNGHGECFKIQLPLKDYSSKEYRAFWIDREELEETND